MGDKVLLCAVLVVLLFSAVISAFAGRDEPTRVYVAGDSEAAIETRRVLARVYSEAESRACFSVEDDGKADLTLKIGEREASGGLNAMFGLGVNYTTTVVTGQLVDKSGKILWEDSKQGECKGLDNQVSNILASLDAKITICGGFCYVYCLFPA